MAGKWDCRQHIEDKCTWQYLLESGVEQLWIVCYVLLACLCWWVLEAVCWLQHCAYNRYMVGISQPVLQ